MKYLILPILLFSTFNSFASDLKSTEVARNSGESVKFEEIEIFACRNIANNRFLFNKSHTDHCWIKNPEDAGIIATKLGGKYWGANTVFFKECPKSMASEKFCDPKKLRDF